MACAVGVEANALHAAYLVTMQETYEKAGYPNGFSRLLWYQFMMPIGHSTWMHTLVSINTNALKL